VIIGHWSNSSAKVERIGDIMTAISRGYFSRSKPIKGEELLSEFIQSWMNAGRNALRGVEQSLVSSTEINELLNSFMQYGSGKKIGKSRLLRNFFFDLMRRHYSDLIFTQKKLKSK
jgi:hypothetical protein